MNVSSTEQMRTSKRAEGPYVKYLVRRETHSSRAIAATLVALLLIVALVYVVIEAILSMSKGKKLLAQPHEMWQQFTEITSDDSTTLAIVTTVAVVLIVLGLIMWGKAFLPGMLGRHSIKDGRVAYIVDDGVIASDVSRKVREEANVPAGQVTTGVSKHSVDIKVVPVTGHRIDEQAISKAAEERINGLNLHPAPKTHLKIVEEGRVAK